MSSGGDPGDRPAAAIGGQQVAGTGGMLVSADYTGVDSDRPLPALGHIGIATELVEDPHPCTVC